jgi:transcriptional regulator with XRE-family HTH domain
MRRWVSSPSYRSTLDVIVAARHASGLSQKAVADLLRKPPSFIAKIELGERRLDIVEFIAIARAVKAEPEELLRRITEALPDKLDF